MVYLVESFLSPKDESIHGYLSLDPATLYAMGAKSTKAIAVDFQVWRLVTCWCLLPPTLLWSRFLGPAAALRCLRGFLARFLHAGFMHMLMNLFVQMSAGWMLEVGVEIYIATEISTARTGGVPAWGFTRMALIYCASGLTGSLLGCVCAPEELSVGASGAIMGIIGAKLGYLYINWDKYNHQSPDGQANLNRKMDACRTALWVVLIFMMGMGNPLVDNWAHLGGLLGGLLMGGLLFSDEAVYEAQGTGLPITAFQRYRGTLCGMALIGANLLLLGVLFTATRQALMQPGSTNGIPRPDPVVNQPGVIGGHTVQQLPTATPPGH